MEDKRYVNVTEGNMSYARACLFWVDINMRGYFMPDIGNIYLKTIAKGIPEGKYVPAFLNGNWHALNRIYDECLRRNIYPDNPKYVWKLKKAATKRVIASSGETPGAVYMHLLEINAPKDEEESKE